MPNEEKIFEIHFGVFKVKIVNYPAWGIPLVLIATIIIIAIFVIS